ncbi:MAG: CHAT domain-containing protein [Paracoccaceae bacterium]
MGVVFFRVTHVLCVVVSCWMLSASDAQAQSQAERAAFQTLMADLGAATTNRPPTQETLQMALDGLPLAERVLGPRSPELLNYMGGIVMIRGFLGQMQDNAEILERMLLIAESTLPPENAGLLKTKGDLATVLALQDPYRALKLAREAYDTSAQIMPETHSLRAQLAETLASILALQGDLDEALELQATVMSAQRAARQNGMQPNVAFAVSYQQNLFAAQRFRDVIDVAQEVLPILQNAPPGMTLQLRTLMAAGMIAEGVPDEQGEADRILREAMLMIPDTPLELVDIRMFGNITGVAAADLPETLRVIERALHIARAEPRISATFDAGLTISRHLLEPETSSADLALSYQRAGDAFGPSHPATLRLGAFYANVLVAEGEWEDAKALLSETERQAKSLGMLDTALLATSGLRGIAQMEGDSAAAIEIGQRLLSDTIAVYGPRSVIALQEMAHYAQALFAANRLDEAQPFVDEGLATVSNALGTNHEITAQFLVLKAHSLFATHQFSVARTYIDRALPILETKASNNEPMLFLARLMQLITTMIDADSDEVRVIARTYIDRAEQAGFHDDPGILMARGLVAISDMAEADDVVAALPRLDAIIAETQALPADQQQFFAMLHIVRALSWLELDPVEGLEQIEAVRARFGDGAIDAFGNDSLALLLDDADLQTDAAAYYRAGLEQMLSASSHDPDSLLKFSRGLAHLHLRNPDLFMDDDTMDVFQLLQWPLERQAGTAMTQAARRFATSDPALAAQLRRRQDLSSQVEVQSDALRLAYAGQDTDQVIALQASLAKLRDDQSALDAELQSVAPEFGVLGGAQPMRVEEVVDLLSPGEALLLLAPTQYDRLENPIPGIAYLVRWDGQTIAAALTPNFIHSTLLRYLRCKIDWDQNFCTWSRPQETETESEEAVGSAGIKRGSFDFGGPQEGYDLDAAHEAYLELIAPIEHGLEGVDHLLFVPGDATMSALPVGLLVRSPVPPGLSEADSYRQAHWLLRDMAVTMLPSVSTLGAQRGPNARASTAQQPFLGVGDPVIGVPSEIACDDLQLAGLKRNLGSSVVTGDLIQQDQSYLSNLDQVRQMSRLPDTRCELEAIQRDLGGGRLLMDAQATEAEVKAINRNGSLADYRVLSFATHGLVAGEAGAAEAALVLTPPSAASRVDDGLLTASEIATFSIDADLVMLSACNTAAGANNGGEALSGLARAFFYAGARRVLVSHWPVNSDAAVALTTSTIQTMADDEASDPAQALRAAALAILDDPDSTVRELRPQHWGPFSLVGTTN